MATTALLVAASAWSRRESRGAHYRSDYPAEEPALAHRTMTTLAAAREIAAALDIRAPRDRAADDRLRQSIAMTTADLAVASRRLPVAARDRRGRAARARRGSRPRRRHHLDRDHPGNDAGPRHHGRAAGRRDRGPAAGGRDLSKAVARHPDRGPCPRRRDASPQGSMC